MKKTTIFLAMLVLSLNGLMAQKTLEVGEGKTYATINAAWTAAKTDPATEIIIAVDEGVFVESASMSTLSDKKVTIVGAGADKTIVKRNSTETFGFGSGQNPNRLFQLNNGSDNLELILEKMTFQTMGFTNANGGGVINANGTNQQFTFKDCNFKNIFARAGAIFQVQGTDSLFSLIVDNCFVEECGAFDNNGMNALFVFNVGVGVFKNSTFMNNIFDAVNVGTQGGGDRDLKVGMLISAPNDAKSLTIENCNFVNNRYITGDTDKVHPMVSVKSKVDPSELSISIKDLISIQNRRASSLDTDIYYNQLFNVIVENSVFNSVYKYESVIEIIDEQEVETQYPAEVTELYGAVIDGSLSYAAYFEMDETLPEIFVDENGVKNLKRIATGIAHNRQADLNITSEKGLLRISAEKPQNLVVYNLMGVQCASFNGKKDVEIALNPGIYIVKTNTAAVKVVVN